MERTNYFNYSDPANQLRPNFSRKKFSTLGEWDLAWEMLEPINIATTRRSEIGLSKKLSPGQKALYFFWYLDAEVENGGFIQFYYNKTDHYLPSIIAGLEFLQDKPLLRLIGKAEELYQQHKKIFDRTKTMKGFSLLYEKLDSFSKLDEQYYKLRNKTIVRIEKYIKENPKEFVTLR